MSGFQRALAAIVVPGGLVALLGAWLLKAIYRTDKGQRAWSYARTRVGRGRRGGAENVPEPQAA